MRFIFLIQFSIDTIESGMKVGKSIFDSAGNLLLGKGVLLNDFLIKRLKSRGVTRLFIGEDSTEDIEPKESIPDMVRGATIKHMKGLFEDVGEIRKEMKNESNKAFENAISSEKFKSTFRNSPAFTKISDDAKNIVDELLCGDSTLGLNSIKTYDIKPADIDVRIHPA